MINPALIMKYFIFTLFNRINSSSKKSVSKVESTQFLGTPPIFIYAEMMNFFAYWGSCWYQKCKKQHNKQIKRTHKKMGRPMA